MVFVIGAQLQNKSSAIGFEPHHGICGADRQPLNPLDFQAVVGVHYIGQCRDSGGQRCPAKTQLQCSSPITCFPQKITAFNCDHFVESPHERNSHVRA